MQIRLKKGRDGPDSLACVRDDGTSTWRRIQRGRDPASALYCFGTARR